MARPPLCPEIVRAAMMTFHDRPTLGQDVCNCVTLSCPIWPLPALGPAAACAICRPVRRFDLARDESLDRPAIGIGLAVAQGRDLAADRLDVIPVNDGCDD